MIYEWEQEEYLISTDPARIDLALVHDFLRHSYWATGIPLEVVRRSIEGSLVFGLYAGDRQIGFARVITDRASFAYLADVFIVEGERGRGLATWLLQTILAHPELQGLRRWMLATRDAHELYRQVGFNELAHPEWFMERWEPALYLRGDGNIETK